MNNIFTGYPKYVSYYRVIIKSVLIVSLFCGCIFDNLCPREAGATNYYVDATDGNDDHTGKMENAAWHTLEKVNGTLFNPGDSILFKRGETWDGQLKIQSEGKANLFISIGDYGSGKKPEIKNSGKNHGISLEGKSFISIKNLKITSAQGSGILITESTKNGLIKIESCDISNCKIDGIAVKDRGNVDIILSNIYENKNNGISAFFSGHNMLWSDKKGNNIKITDCKIYNNYKGGVFLAGDYAVVQRNEIYLNGHSRFDHNLYLIGDNGIIENNLLRDANYGLGFRYEGSRLIFRNNSVKNNCLHGIGLWNDYNNDHYHNEIYNNNIEMHGNKNTPNNSSMAISIGKAENAGSFIGIDIHHNFINGLDDVAGGIWLDGCSQVKINDNYISLQKCYLIYQGRGVTGLISDYNRFVSSKQQPFYCDSHDLSFSEWQLAGYDLHSTYQVP